jgi:hypothetical protein
MLSWVPAWKRKPFQWSFLLLEKVWLGISSCNLTWPFRISCQAFILDSINELLGVVQRMSRACVALFLTVCVCAASGSATDIWISVAVFILHYLRISYGYLIFLLQSLSCLTFPFHVYGHMAEVTICYKETSVHCNTEISVRCMNCCSGHVLTLLFVYPKFLM